MFENFEKHLLGQSGNDNWLTNFWIGSLILLGSLLLHFIVFKTIKSIKKRSVPFGSYS